MAERKFKCDIWKARPNQDLPERELDITIEEDMKEIKSILQNEFLRNQDGPLTDTDANDAVQAFRDTYNFYHTYLHRDSYDGHDAVINSSVRYGHLKTGAEWMGGLNWIRLGGGDQYVYKPVTKSLAIVAHELTHGLIDYTAGWSQEGAQGSLGEHFCDVIGSMVKQVKKGGQTANQADWLLGEDQFNNPPIPAGTAIRSMKAPGEAYDNPLVDVMTPKDPQVRHMKDYNENADVHTNAGIMNYAFYLAATAFGNEQPCHGVGHIWWTAVADAEHSSKVQSFLEFADLVVSKAGDKHAAVKSAFQAVGLNVK